VFWRGFCHRRDLRNIRLQDGDEKSPLINASDTWKRTRRNAKTQKGKYSKYCLSLRLSAFATLRCFPGLVGGIPNS
jgi:hypothetical protein